MKIQYQLANGEWRDVESEESVEHFLLRCEKYNGWAGGEIVTVSLAEKSPLTREEVLVALQSGTVLSNHSEYWYAKCRDAAAVPSVSPPPRRRGIKRGGQLWERCRCGLEPVYLPLHLCERCWPK